MLSFDINLTSNDVAEREHHVREQHQASPWPLSAASLPVQTSALEPQAELKSGVKLQTFCLFMRTASATDKCLYTQRCLLRLISFASSIKTIKLTLTTCVETTLSTLSFLRKQYVNTYSLFTPVAYSSVNWKNLSKHFDIVCTMLQISEMWVEFGTSSSKKNVAPLGSKADLTVLMCFIRMRTPLPRSLRMVSFSASLCW